MDRDQLRSLPTWIPRPDGWEKARGRMRYLTDLHHPGMLIGGVLRSDYPHARIRHIDTSRALQIPGVRAVLTWRDVPGLNRYGIVIQDQPVFCEDRVRYVGDVIAAVAADSHSSLEQALAAIQVVYEPLPVVSQPEEALRRTSVKLHPTGNLLHRRTFSRGDVKQGFAASAVIVEAVYETPRQMHTYMETEGGMCIPEPDGSLTLYAPTQHGYGDRAQLARILGWPEERIRIVSSPIGVSFGGKDELNVQPYLALLALATWKPVKIHQSRAESVRSGLKRHPMRIWMRTGAARDGRILAHDVRIVADTGAYATLGPEVLDFAVEHATGPYIIDHVRVRGYSVHTNCGVAGEFRGFGGNQVTFALEGQMDRLADALGIDPLEVRRRNFRAHSDCGPLGQTIAPTEGADEVLAFVERKRAEVQSRHTVTSASAYHRRGIGIAVTMHGGGLGLRRPDHTGGRVRLTRHGKIELAFGFEECGQGVIAAIPLLAAELLDCAVEDVEVVLGDTSRVPRSGSSTASRATGMVWHTLKRIRPDWESKMLSLAARVAERRESDFRLGPGGVHERNAGRLVASYADLAAAAGDDLPEVEIASHFPVTPDTWAQDGAHYLYSFAGVVAEVDVDLLTAEVRVTGLHQGVWAGGVVNPMGYVGQIEGGGVMGMGFALMEDALMDEGRYVTRNLDTYLIPTALDVPEMELEAIIPKVEDDHGPRGVGEIGTVAVAPAIAAAIHDAIGVWITALPVRQDVLLAEMAKRGETLWRWMPSDASKESTSWGRERIASSSS